MNRYYTSNREPLQETRIQLPAAREREAEGMAEEATQIQANGQTGQLPEFWESLGPNSGWLGGRARAGSAGRTTSTAWCRSPTCSTTRS